MAVQWKNGEWSPALHPQTKERMPFTRSDLEAHVAGTKSLGHYLLNTDGECKLFVFDLDVAKTARPQDQVDDPHAPPVVWIDELQEYVEGDPRAEFLLSNKSRLYSRLVTELRITAEALASKVKTMYDLPVAVSYSGSKGLHVYALCGRLPATDVQELALEVIRAMPQFEPRRGNNFFRHTSEPQYGYPHVEIEVFPKQSSLDGKDLGNLVRLPLGVNRKSGNRAFFIDCNAPQDVLVERDPVAALESGDPWGK